MSLLITQLIDPLEQMQLFLKVEQDRIQIALQEALTNAVLHGNLEMDSELRQEDEQVYTQLAAVRQMIWPYCDRRVHVTATFTSDRVKYIIRDEGPGFDPNSVQDPTTVGNVGRVGGRGLMLIRSFVDDVSFNAQGSEITLVKYTSRENTMPAQTAQPDDLVVSADVLLFEFDEP